MDKELNNNNLTAKQKRFCLEYMIDFNASGAAERSGYSKKTAQQIGSENLLKPVIKAEIERLQKENRDKYNVTIDEVVCRVKQLMLTDDYNPVHTTNLKAAEILNKMFGFNFENKETQTDDSTELTFKIIKSNNGNSSE